MTSLGLHLAAGWLIGSAFEGVKVRQALLHEKHMVRALEMPEVSFFRPPRVPSPESAGSRSPAAGSNAGNRAAVPAAPATPSTAAPAEPGASGEQPVQSALSTKRLVLPPEVVRKPDKQVLVQLEVPPDVKLKTKVAVPELMLWQLPVPPKPKQPVVAARSEERPLHERETPTANPQLTAPNQEQGLANLRHAALPVPPAITPPAIPLQVANTTPIRLLDGRMGDRLPNSTVPPGPSPEAVHVISVPEVPVPQARMIVLPPVSQAGPPGEPSGANTSGGAGRGNAKDAGKSGTSSDTQGRGGVDAAASGTGPASSTASGAASGPAGRVAGTGTGSGTERSTSLDGRGGDGRAAGGVANAATGTGPLPPGTVRVVRPKDGKFSVVVLGPSNLDIYPEAASILSGKLVYSVYIRAGGRKEWILQYCLPRAVEQTVKLRGSAVPIEAPYPFLMYRPNLSLLNDPEYVIVHGFITTSGRFEHLSAVGDLDAASRGVLIGTLEHWEFRPASRDGEPSVVEIALIIPREPM